MAQYNARAEYIVMDIDVGVQRLVWGVSSTRGNIVADSFAADIAHLVSKSSKAPFNVFCWMTTIGLPLH